MRDRCQDGSSPERGRTGGGLATRLSITNGSASSRGFRCRLRGLCSGKIIRALITNAKYEVQPKLRQKTLKELGSLLRSGVGY
jgi:hypothetical protein